jgi:hypothetical protein
MWGALVVLGACGTTLPTAAQQSEEDRYRVELDRCVDDAATAEQWKTCRANAKAAHAARRGAP